jgi:hypothetical protein
MRKLSNSYSAIHHWLRRKYGKPNFCEMCGSSEEKKYEYALKKGRVHKRDINNYMRLCCKCHINYDFNDDRRKKIAMGLVGNKYTKGFKHSDETKNMISILTSGNKNPFYGRRHSDESIAKMKESHKGQIVTADTREKLSISLSGSGNPFYGKKHSEEAKQKMRGKRK